MRVDVVAADNSLRAYFDVQRLGFLNHESFGRADRVGLDSEDENTLLVNVNNVVSVHVTPNP
jgi:hypothetical protein